MFLFSLFYFKFDIFSLAHSQIHNDNSQTFNLSLDRSGVGTLCCCLCLLTLSLPLCVLSLSLSLSVAQTRALLSAIPLTPFFPHVLTFFQISFTILLPLLLLLLMLWAQADFLQTWFRRYFFFSLPLLLIETIFCCTTIFIDFVSFKVNFICLFG